MHASTQTDHAEAWLVVDTPTEMQCCLEEVVAENEELREQLTASEHRIESLSKELEACQLNKRGAGPSSSAPLELGYMVLRAPDDRAHLRGHHRTSWASLMSRLSIPPRGSRAGFYIRLFENPTKASELWKRTRLELPYPVDPR